MRKGASLGLALLMLHSPWAAAAESPRGAIADKAESYPWLHDVSLKDQDTAYALFREGNGLLKDSAFMEAVEKYRQALQHWDHPAIHYNLALALMNFDQPLEVYEHLEAAMRYGPDPLEAERFEYARAYKDLVAKQLVRVNITCDEPGTLVTLDGKRLFVGPGRYEGLTRTGTHSLIARKPGYFTYDRSQLWTSEKPMTLDLRMYQESDLTQYRRRWSVWMPWAVMGSGLAMAAGGGLLHLGTAQSYRTYDDGIDACGGCVPQPGLVNARTRGDALQKTAVGAYAVGGAALLTGAVLLFLNRPQAYRVDPYANGEERSDTPPPGGGEDGRVTLFRF